jgi:hypothetical protein
MVCLRAHLDSSALEIPQNRILGGSFMRTLCRAFLASILAATFAGQLQAENEQVQIDIQVFKVLPEMLYKVGMAPEANNGTKCTFKVIAEKEQGVWHKVLLADGQVKVLAEPRLVTLNGRPAHFFCGAQQAYLAPGEGKPAPTVEYRDVGTSVDVVATVKADQSVYLEAQLRLSKVEEGLAITTSYGLIPGFSERAVRSCVELKSGSTFVLCPGYEEKNGKPESCLLIFMTPHVLSSTPVVPASIVEPARDQAARLAAVLAAEYRQACAAGDKELAAKLGRMALELDPLCLGQTAAPAAPRTLPAPMPTMPIPAPAASEENEYRSTIIPAARESQPPPPCPEPSEKEIIEALNARTGSPKLKLEDIGDEVEIVCEKVMDKVDEPRFFPLVGPARLHHCHWKCTVYYNETVRSNNPFPMVVKNKHVETVYIDKDVLHPTDSESKPATVPVKAEEQPKRQGWRERFRSLFKPSSVEGTTLPSGNYLGEHKPQNYLPDPDFPLEKELKAIQEENKKRQPESESATEQKKSEQKPTKRSPAEKSKTQNEKEIELRLSTPITVDFHGTTLQQVIADLRTMTKMNIVLSPDLGSQALDQAIQLKLEDVSLRSVLNILLRQAHLTYDIQDSALRITMVRDASGKLAQEPDQFSHPDGIGSAGEIYLAPFYVDPERILRAAEMLSQERDGSKSAPKKPEK